MGLLNMTGTVTPVTPTGDAAVSFVKKLEEGGAYTKEKEQPQEKKSNINEDIVIILSNWISNNN